MNKMGTLKLNVILISTCLNVMFVGSVIQSCYKDKHTWIYGKYCIEVNDDTRDWDDARSYCRKRGGDLISIQSSDMQRAIERQLKLHTHTEAGYWIGATDRQHEGHWTWVHGSPRMVYSNWESGQGPLQSGFFFSDGGLEDCAMVRPDSGYKWHDGPCAGGFAFHYALICQYELMQTHTVPTKHYTTSKPTTTASTSTFKPTTSIPTTTASTSTIKPTTSNPTSRSTTVLITQPFFPTGDGDPLETAKTATKTTPTTANRVTSKLTTETHTTAKPTTPNPTTTKQVTAKPTTEKTTRKPTTETITTAKPTTPKPTTTQTPTSTILTTQKPSTTTEGTGVVIG